MKEIKSDIKSGQIRRCYLIYGEERYLVQDLKRQLRQAVAGDDTMNCTCLTGKDVTQEAIIDVAETMPFFADRRLILVEDSGFFKKEADKLAAYLPGMPETTCLVFVETDIDKRSKLYKKISSLGHVAECPRKSQGELKRWVVRGLAQSGKKVQESTVDAFLIRTGDDMVNIRQEMEKLIAYTGDREVVTLQDVETMTTPQLSDRVFDMIDAIGTRDQRRALDLYYDLLQLKEPPVKILILIGRQFRGILQVKELREKGLTQKQIEERTGYRGFIARRYLNQAARFSRKELEEFVALCVETDEAVKNGNLRDTLAVEMMIVTFSGGSRA